MMLCHHNSYKCASCVRVEVDHACPLSRDIVVILSNPMGSGKSTHTKFCSYYFNT